jgi:hypothetical protein
VERRIKQLYIEKQALKKYKDKASRERLEKLEAELADLVEKSTEMKGHWQAEKESVQKLRTLREQIEQAPALFSATAQWWQRVEAMQWRQATRVQVMEAVAPPAPHGRLRADPGRPHLEDRLGVVIQAAHQAEVDRVGHVERIQIAAQGRQVGRAFAAQIIAAVRRLIEQRLGRLFFGVEQPQRVDGQPTPIHLVEALPVRVKIGDQRLPVGGPTRRTAGLIYLEAQAA